MSYKAHMHGGGKSSDCIVPTKCANKGGGPSAERMEGRRSAEETSRHGPMLDTAPENIGALQCRGNACSRYRLGAERSEVGTVCVKRASTGLCGGQPATAVPTATQRGRVQMVSIDLRDRAGEKIKDGRHVGLDFYDLLIEAFRVLAVDLCGGVAHAILAVKPEAKTGLRRFQRSMAVSPDANTSVSSFVNRSRSR